MSAVLEQLSALLTQRRSADPETSYVAGLHHAGLNAILEKVAEECTETLLAAKDADDAAGRAAVIHETADLWFHSLVMLSHLGLDGGQVLAELERRSGRSGLVEKAARSGKKTGAT